MLNDIFNLYLNYWTEFFLHLLVGFEFFHRFFELKKCMRVKSFELKIEWNTILIDFLSVINLIKSFIMIWNSFKTVSSVKHLMIFYKKNVPYWFLDSCIISSFRLFKIKFSSFMLVIDEIRAYSEWVPILSQAIKVIFWEINSIIFYL